MAIKNVLVPYHTIVNGNMANTSVTSSVTNIQYLDNVMIQLNFTTSGSPVGTFAVQVSVDYAQDFMGNVTNSGTWATIASGSTSSGSPVVFDINQSSAPYIRVVYTKSSGTGTLNAFITGKQV